MPAATEAVDIAAGYINRLGSAASLTWVQDTNPDKIWAACHPLP